MFGCFQCVLNDLIHQKDTSGSKIQYIHITKPELTRIKGSYLQKLVTWFELKKLIKSKIVSMDNLLKFQKPMIPIFIWLE